MSRHAQYIKELFDPPALQESAHLAAKWLRKHPEITAIAARGVSGTTFAGAVSFLTGIPVILVRKDTEQCHSSNRVEFPDIEDGNYAIVDDFISSGDTVKIIIDKIRADSDWKCKAVLQYSERASHQDLVTYKRQTYQEVVL